MNIALFHELANGGARRGANTFADNLRQLGHIVDAYVIDEEENIDEHKMYSSYFFFKFHSMPWNGHNWKIKLYHDTIELFKLKNLHQHIAKKINRKDYDLIFVHGSRFTQAPYILRFLKIPSVYYAQETLRMIYENDDLLPTNTDIFRRIYEFTNRLNRKLIDKKNIFSAKKLLSNSAYTRQNLKYAYGLKATIAYMGVNTHKFIPGKEKREIDLLFIGSRHEKDGYFILQEALKQTQSKPHLEMLIKEEKWISNDKELLDLYQKAKITLCLGIKEPFGLIPLEAMASGSIVIASNEGGYKETVVDGKTGYLIERNAAELAKKIDRLLNNQTLATKMSRHARKQTEITWAWEKRTKELEKHLLNVFNQDRV